MPLSEQDEATYKRLMQNASSRKYAARNRDKIFRRDKLRYTKESNRIQLYQVERRMWYKRQLADLLGGVCNRCGFANLAALDFHHKNSNDKLFNVSHAIMRPKQTGGWDKVKAEALKCELLCRNCHTILHCRYGEIEEKNANP